MSPISAEKKRNEVASSLGEKKQWLRDLSGEPWGQAWRPGFSPERFRRQGFLDGSGRARLDIGTPFYWGHVLEGLFNPALGPGESRAIERWLETRLGTRMGEMFGPPAAEAHWAATAWETRAIETSRHVALFYGSARWAVLDRGEIAGEQSPDNASQGRGRRLAASAEALAELRALGKQIAMELMRRDPGAIQALAESVPGAASWAAEATAIAEALSLARVAASAARKKNSERRGDRDEGASRKPRAL